MSNQNTFLDTFKSGSKRFATLVADTGAKTMLKVRFVVMYACAVGKGLLRLYMLCIVLVIC